MNGQKSVKDDGNDREIDSNNKSRKRDRHLGLVVAGNNPTIASESTITSNSSSTKKFKPNQECDTNVSSGTAAPDDKKIAAAPRAENQREGHKRERRLAMNRVTARDRRKRKRLYIDELQDNMQRLAAKVQQVREESNQLRSQIVPLKAFLASRQKTPQDQVSSFTNNDNKIPFSSTILNQQTRQQQQQQQTGGSIFTPNATRSTNNTNRNMLLSSVSTQGHDQHEHLPSPVNNKQQEYADILSRQVPSSLFVQLINQQAQQAQQAQQVQRSPRQGEEQPAMNLFQRQQLQFLSSRTLLPHCLPSSVGIDQLRAINELQQSPTQIRTSSSYRTTDPDALSLPYSSLNPQQRILLNSSLQLQLNNTSLQTRNEQAEAINRRQHIDLFVLQDNRNIFPISNLSATTDISKRGKGDDKTDERN